ncbi:hypothetical protein P879_02087 [Paragonimus westermani]|uniref:Uncharacterized protein n=1 Tax=Paragonimus westermani TaxID=34504 RepID=A0A8T0DUC9_9TREM|nr:hypothetical protein P879_02087 [Paragonimus westermani]
MDRRIVFLRSGFTRFCSTIFFQRWAILKQPSLLVEFLMYVLYCYPYSVFISASEFRTTISTHKDRQANRLYPSF